MTRKAEPALRSAIHMRKSPVYRTTIDGFPRDLGDSIDELVGRA
jgi:hypothetical protein